MTYVFDAIIPHLQRLDHLWSDEGLTRCLTVHDSRINFTFGGVDTTLAAVAWTMHLLRKRGQCTCCGGVDNALAAVAWTMHLLRWRGQCTCCGGVDNALAAVAWTMHLLRWRGQCTCCGGVDTALAAVAWTLHLLRWCEQLENRGHKFS